MAVELATAYVSLVPSFRGGTSVIQREASKMGTAAANSMGSSISKASGKTGAIGKAFTGIAKLGGALFAGEQIIGAFKGFIDEATEAQKVSKLTAQVLKTTGGAANVSAKDVDRLATALSKKAGVDDEVIASGENVLLTFTNVRNEQGKGNKVFNEATKAALDMSSALSQDMQSSVIQVGKALNDPIKGVTALSRVGVSFTAQQKEQIKALVESGNTLGAQKLILHELNTEFGGAAAAGATASDKLGVAWGNVQEQLGTILLPIFNKVAEWLAVTLPKAIVWMQDAVTKIQAFFNEHRKAFQNVGKVLKVLFTWIKIQVKVFIKAVQIEFKVIAAIVTFFRDHVYGKLVAIVKTMVKVITGIIRAAMATWRVAWGPIKFIYDVFHRVVYGPLIAIVKTMFRIVRDTIRTGIDTARTAWSVIGRIVDFFRDHVYQPVVSTVGALRDRIHDVIVRAVDLATGAWEKIRAVYDFFVNKVYLPVTEKFGELRDSVGKAFSAAVTAVSNAWNLLKDIVKAPINIVIGFYNKGIRGVWNAVISKIPGVGDLPEIATLSRGGKVPGVGNRDTVPALLTPGEFVVTKNAAQVWGPKTLATLNNPRGTIDPAIFGYATGGYVRSPDEALAWARAQAGKPYQYPMVGPDSYDCSGFTSALINFIMGLYPYSRRHSSGTVGSDPAVAAGVGDPATGLSLGARPPYQTNSQGSFVGHIAATLAGVNLEATPPVVLYGGGARGALSSTFTQRFHLPGYGGLTAADKAVVTALSGLPGLRLPDMGPPMGDLLGKMMGNLPHMVYDFLIHKLPGIIVDAVKKVFSGLNPFASGGPVRQAGPILVGERGPEVLYANRGDYIQPNVLPFERGRGRTVNMNHYGQQVTPATVAAAFRMSDLSA